MRGAARRLARLERKCETLAATREPITHVNVRIVDFPGWEIAEEMGYQPGDKDLPWFRKSP
jgi:hypothetical protein